MELYLRKFGKVRNLFFTDDIDIHSSYDSFLGALSKKLAQIAAISDIRMPGIKTKTK